MTSVGGDAVVSLTLMIFMLTTCEDTLTVSSRPVLGGLEDRLTSAQDHPAILR